jgi:hypothetical protein
MNTRWLVLAGVLACFELGAVRGAEAEKAAGPRWLSDWEEGRRMARAENKPIFVVFRCEN